MNISLTCLLFYVRARKIIDRYFRADKEIRYWRQNREEVLRLGERGYRVKIEDMGLKQENLELIRRYQQEMHEVVIAEIDQDGFMLSHFGPMLHAPTVHEEQFMARKRFELSLVALDGYVGVRKDYKGNKLSFVNEVRALHTLGLCGCNVPAIMDMDLDNLTLTLSYILGPVLREELARKGATLRDRDVNTSPSFVGLGQKARWLKRVQEGKRVLYDVIDAQFVEELLIEVKKIHASGFIWNDLKYGNVIIEERSGKPYLIDFESVRYCPELGENASKTLSDENIEKFNLHFGAEQSTESRMTEGIKDGRAVNT